MSAPRNYSRSGGFKEGRAGFRPMEAGGQHGGRSGETAKHETGYRSRRLEQTPVRDPSPEADTPELGGPEKEEAASETPATAPEPVPPAPDRPVEKKPKHPPAVPPVHPRMNRNAQRTFRSLSNNPCLLCEALVLEDGLLS